MEDDALKALRKGIKSGELGFIKLYMEYMYGKPKQSMEISSTKGGVRFVIGSKK